MTDKSLQGGTTNEGKVLRSGAHVLRPSTPHTTSVHALLGALNEAGFDGAPMPVRVDGEQREVLTFIEGDVPLVPYPAWSQSDAALVSMGQLLRRLHDASRGFDAHKFAWSEALADPVKATTGGRTVMCHNDVELSNVVFRDGTAVAFIDFEFAAPGRPMYDLAQLARLCVPIEHEVDQKRMGWLAADRSLRLRVLADAYGVEQAERAELLGAIDDALEVIEKFVRQSTDVTDPAARITLAATGGLKKYDRRSEWWGRHRKSFAEALG